MPLFKRLVILLLIPISLLAQKSSLPRSTPEAEGVSSAGVISFRPEGDRRVDARGAPGGHEACGEQR